MSEPGDAPSDQRERQAIALYECTVQEIASFKSQQWQTAYYVGLLLSATFGAAETAELDPIGFVFLALVMFMATAAGSHIVRALRDAIEERRARLRSCRAALPDLRELHGERQKYEPPVHGYLCAAVWVGFVIWSAILLHRVAAGFPE